MATSHNWTAEQLPLISSLGDSPANPSPSLVNNRDRMTKGISGPRCSALLTRSSLLSSLVKMFLASSAWHSNVCVLTWKASALKSNRLLFRLVPSMRRTEETGFGLLPTPTSRDWKDGTAQSCQNVPVNGHLGRAVHLLPTIRAADADRGGRGDLIQAVRGNKNKHFRLLPTVRANKWGIPDSHGSTKAWGQLLPTPHANCSTGPGTQGREGGMNLQTAVGGSLNPRFVEGMLGFPQDWTSLEE